MSRAMLPSAHKPFGIKRVCRAGHMYRATIHRWKPSDGAPPPKRGKRGPKRCIEDDALLIGVRAVLDASLFVGEGHQKVWSKLRYEHGVKTSARRVFRIMREHGILPHDRSTAIRVPAVHDGTIVTQQPDVIWAIDATAGMTDEGNATVFILIDHCTGECLGVRAGLRGTRFEAIECVREEIWATKAHYDIGIVKGVALRHDHGSQFISHAFQDELNTTGIASSPSFVRQREGNGCAERFIRTLKEQLLWLEQFGTVDELNQALRDFAHRFNNHGIIGRLGYRTPAQHRRILLAEVA